MSPHHWNWSSEHVVASDLSLTSQVVEPLLARLNADQWPDRDVFGVHLAIEEALVNAIKHGNQEDASKRVHVYFRVNDQSVQIEIADEGPGFDPTAVPDPTTADHVDMPNGRGIMLMRSFMSHVHYNPAGNRVVMEKSRTHAEP
jgi:serine/threonine-protein kinase RsbW